MKTVSIVAPLCAALVILPATAAELRGHFTFDANALPGPQVTVQCGDHRGSATINSEGDYVVRGLPNNRDCSFSVSAGSRNSKRIPFSTTKSVTIYSGTLRSRDDRILVLKQ